MARLGFITQFLSKPVMDGFVTGLALFVAVGQLNKLFGVPKGEGNTVEKLIAIVRELPQANWITFAVGASALALLFLLPRWNKKIPAGLVVLFGYIALSTVLGLNANYGVEIVGSLPQGLPKLTLPLVPLTAYLAMIAPAIGVLLVAYSEALGVAREFGEKHGYEVDPNQELNAHAVANLVSSLFGGMIAAGSMSASAVKEGAGARSQVANLVTWGMAVVTVLFLTPLFRNLPEAVLAALIIHAVWHIIASRKLQRVRLISRTEFWLGTITFAGVILLDVLQGMLLGLLSSILLVAYRSSRPHLSSLGRVPGVPGAYSDLTRHPENTPVPGVLIFRLDAPIYYANALTVRDRMKTLVEEAETPPRALIFDAAAEDTLDVTSADVIKGLVKEFQGQGITVYAVEVHAPVIEFGRKSGLFHVLTEDHIFPTIDAALVRRFACERMKSPLHHPIRRRPIHDDQGRLHGTGMGRPRAGACHGRLLHHRRRSQRDGHALGDAGHDAGDPGAAGAGSGERTGGRGGRRDRRDGQPQGKNRAAADRKGPGCRAQILANLQRISRVWTRRRALKRRRASARGC